MQGSTILIGVCMVAGFGCSGGLLEASDDADANDALAVSSAASTGASSGAGGAGPACGAPLASGATITAAAGGATGATLLDDLQYPSGLALRDGVVYFSENAGNDTTIGGVVRVERFDPSTGQRVTVVDHPMNPEGVAVASNGQIFLGSYDDSIDGDHGTVTRVDPLTCKETPVVELHAAIADMAMDTNDDLYVAGAPLEFGPQDYRLPATDRTAPVVVTRGDVEGLAIAADHGEVFYTRPGGIGTIAADGSTGLIPALANYGLTTSRLHVYYLFGDALYRVPRSGGAAEVVADGLTNPRNARFDPVTGRVYVITDGTGAHDFKDGQLLAIVPPGEP